jgi:hypothetical protein
MSSSLLDDVYWDAGRRAWIYRHRLPTPFANCSVQCHHEHKEEARAVLDARGELGPCPLRARLGAPG